MTTYNELAVKQRYGQLPGKDIVLGYLKALKVIIGADGEVAEEEMAALLQLMDDMGAADDVRAEVKAFDNDAVTLESVVPDMKPGGRRAKLLIRDAIQIGSADGVYAVEEQAAVAKVAQLLKVDENFVSAAEALVEIESAAAKLRTAILL